MPKELFRLNNGRSILLRDRNIKPTGSYHLVTVGGKVKPKALDPKSYAGSATQWSRMVEDGCRVLSKDHHHESYPYRKCSHGHYGLAATTDSSQSLHEEIGYQISASVRSPFEANETSLIPSNSGLREARTWRQ